MHFIVSLVMLFFFAIANSLMHHPIDHGYGLGPGHHHGPHPNSSSANDSIIDQTPNFTFDQLLNLTTTFFDTFIYPHNAAEAKKINSTLFADDVLGRVDVTRTFNGRELNTEYAFGLFSNIVLNPHSFTLLGVPTAYEITKFTANANIVALDTIVTFNISALGVQAPVEVLFFATFNSRGQMSQYDATFRFLEWQFDWLLTLGMPLLHVNTTAAVVDITSQLLAQSICATEVTYCLGDDQQYDSTPACVDFLTKQIRFGTGYELGMNTLLCRMVHQNMVPSRPAVHCPHIVSPAPSSHSQDLSLPLC